jgi:hypothetical protein
MSVSFWKAEGKIPIEQTSQSITALNGLNFSGGQELRIKVPPTTKFIKPDECYIQGDFLITPDTTNASAVALQLHERLGGQSLIRDISIYSSAEKGSVLLEQITNYNSMVSVMRDYDSNDSLKNKRALTEGTTVWKPQTRGTLGTTRSECADSTDTNPYFKNGANGAGNKVDNITYRKVKLQIPLETGIFRNPKVWVNMLTGLEIVITLEDAVKVLRPLDSVMRNRRLKLNPRFHSINGSSAPDNWANASATDTFYITTDNSNITPSTCGFVKGERINFVDPSNSFTSVFDNAPIISTISASATANGGEGLLQITLTDTCELTSASSITNASWFMYSDSLHTGDNAYNPKYTFSNVELVVQEVDMGSSYVNSVLSSMKEKGVIVHDILSAQNYRYSQNKEDVVANIRLPLVNARAKSLICMPTDATVYVGKNLMNGHLTYDITGSGNAEDETLFACEQFRGISDHLTDYQFIYDGRLQPSRPVRCSKISSKTSIDAQPLIETTKALQQAEISARSLSEYNRNFVVSRALALNSGVYDARNKDFNLQVNYQETTSPTKNHLWLNFCFHLRRISISQNSISVEY